MATEMPTPTMKIPNTTIEVSGIMTVKLITISPFDFIKLHEFLEGSHKMLK
jgi:hypothetical protein